MNPHLSGWLLWDDFKMYIWVKQYPWTRKKFHNEFTHSCLTTHSKIPSGVLSHVTQSLPMWAVFLDSSQVFSYYVHNYCLFISTTNNTVITKHSKLPLAVIRAHLFLNSGLFSTLGFFSLTIISSHTNQCLASLSWITNSHKFPVAHLIKCTVLPGWVLPVDNKPRLNLLHGPVWVQC